MTRRKGPAEHVPPRHSGRPPADGEAAPTGATRQVRSWSGSTRARVHGPSAQATRPEVAASEVVEDFPTETGRVLRTRVGAEAPRVPRNVYRQPSGRRFSAGRALAVGLICFALWTLFDANQLYHNAMSSPFGARRTVSLTILRPLAAVANALKVSGPVNAADSALGRNTAASSRTLPTVPVVAVRPPNNAGVSGLPPRPHTRSGQSIVTTLPVIGPPALAQPTVRHPLVLLDIGDSIGEDLGMGLGDVFSGDPYVRVLEKAVIDTGLGRPDYYNWPAELAAELRKYHPGAVVVMMGANDNQALITASGKGVPVGTARWNTLYAERIDLVMSEVTSSGAHLLWVGLPPLASPAVGSAFARKLNAMAEKAALSHPGVSYVSSWSVLGGPKGSFVQYKRVNGSIQQIRYSDGVHLAPAGWDLLASYLLGPMTREWGVRLHAAPLMRLG